MKGLNMVHIIGNLGQEPEMKYTQSAKAVTEFSVATNRSWKDSSGNLVTETTWHRVICWESLAEVCNQNLAKGDAVYVQGRLHNDEWTGKDGKIHTGTEIVADVVNFLSPKKDKGTAEAPAAPGVEKRQTYVEKALAEMAKDGIVPTSVTEIAPGVNGK